MARTNMETRLQQVVNYLIENYHSDCAQAVERAAAEVTLAQQNEAYIQKFNRMVNKRLSEALIIMNCDKDCPTGNLRHVRKLIEAYHEIHGLDTDDYYGGNDIEDAETMYGVAEVEVDGDEDWMPAGDEEYDMEEGACEDGDLEDCILNSVGVGEVRKLDALCNSLGDADPLTVLDVVRELVRDGRFEVQEREPYNGYITAVLRVR